MLFKRLSPERDRKIVVFALCQKRTASFPSSVSFRIPCVFALLFHFLCNPSNRKYNRYELTVLLKPIKFIASHLSRLHRLKKISSLRTSLPLPLSSLAPNKILRILHSPNDTNHSNQLTRHTTLSTHDQRKSSLLGVAASSGVLGARIGRLTNLITMSVSFPLACCESPCGLSPSLDVSQILVLPAMTIPLASLAAGERSVVITSSNSRYCYWARAPCLPLSRGSASGSACIATTLCHQHTQRRVRVLRLDVCFGLPCRVSIPFALCLNLVVIPRYARVYVPIGEQRSA